MPLFKQPGMQSCKKNIQRRSAQYRIYVAMRFLEDAICAADCLIKWPFLSHLTLICCRRVLTLALVSQKIQPAFKSEPLSAKTPQLLRKFLQKSSNVALYNRSKHATGIQAKPGQLYPRITLIKAMVSCRFPTPRLYGKQNQGLGLGSESGPGSPVPRNTTSV